MIEKNNPAFERFLNKNSFVQGLDVNRRKILLKNFKSKKNTNDFDNHLNKLYHYFQINGKMGEIQGIQETENKNSSDKDEKETQNNSFFQIAETVNVDDLKESEITEKFFIKIKYDDRNIWDSLNPREVEIKKQLANFQAKLFILEKKIGVIKVGNQELDEQNKTYEQQVANLMKDKTQADKEKKQFERKINQISLNYNVSDDIYTSLKYVLNKNYEEIDNKAYNKAKKALLIEREKEKEENKIKDEVKKPLKSTKLRKSVTTFISKSKN